MSNFPVKQYQVTFNRIHADILRLHHRQNQINRYLEQKLINRKLYNDLTESLQKKIIYLNKAASAYTDLIQEQILR
jgi:hypothetical protein